MPYIPNQHQHYNLLPRCSAQGGEVFSYPSALIESIEALLPAGESLIPYGYSSYAEYDAQIEAYHKLYALDNPPLETLLNQLKTEIKERNVKEDWTVVRFLGDSTDSFLGLTHGQCYYWPCSKGHPTYEGVIDDEEFTSYLYSTSKNLWEVLEDPLGITKNP